MKVEMKKRHRVLMVGALVTALIYIIWRLFFTLPLHAGIVSLVAGIALVTAELVGVFEAIEHYRNMSSNKTPAMPEIPSDWYPDVDMLIATHNEDKELLYKTVNGCLHQSYPDPRKVHIYLCDDTNRPEIRALAAQMKVGYFGLTENKHAKAGNLNYALKQTTSPLVATLDADMIPTSRFLMETVPYFFLPRMERLRDGTWREREKPDEEMKIGFIQTPQSFYNPDLFQYNLYSEKSIPNEQDYFFRDVNVGRNRTNSAIYAGSNTLISRQALEDVDYIKLGSITEDFATGIEIQKEGYLCYAVDKTLAHGLAPTDVPSLIKQRERWGRGCVQTIRAQFFHFGKMKIATRLSYFSSFLYWWTFMRRFIYIASPILFTVFGVRIVDCSLIELAVFWLPYYLLYNRALRVISGNIRNQRWSNIVDTIIFPYMIIPIFLESIGVRQRKFIVTSKAANTGSGSDFRFAIPHLILMMATCLGLVFSVYGIVVYHAYANLILVFWLLLNSYFLLMAVFFMRGKVNFRHEERLAAQVDVKVTLASGVIFEGKTCDVSESGIAILFPFPEYIPYDEKVDLDITTERYSAKLTGHVTHVTQVDDTWKYSLQVRERSERDKMEYLQIVFDRHHTLPVVIQSNVLKEVSSNLRGRKGSMQASNRKLPRVSVHREVRTEENGLVTVEDFNYEYIRLSFPAVSPERITLLLDTGLAVSCLHLPNMGTTLYHIENWKEIAADPRLRDALTAWYTQQTALRETVSIAE
ncbi:MAG: glycosyltransferase [Evtepia sp.]